MCVSALYLFYLLGVKDNLFTFNFSVFTSFFIVVPCLLFILGLHKIFVSLFKCNPNGLAVWGYDALNLLLPVVIGISNGGEKLISIVFLYLVFALVFLVYFLLKPSVSASSNKTRDLFFKWGSILCFSFLLWPFVLFVITFFYRDNNTLKASIFLITVVLITLYDHFRFNQTQLPNKSPWKMAIAYGITGTISAFIIGSFIFLGGLASFDSLTLMAVLFPSGGALFLIAAFVFLFSFFQLIKILVSRIFLTSCRETSRDLRFYYCGKVSESCTFS